MEYGKILSRSVNISFGGSGGGGGVGNGNGDVQPFEDEITAVVIGVVIAFACVAILVGIALWVASTIARGSLIASVDTIESGEKSSFRKAWGAGWHKAKTLLGIGLLPAIPGLILFVAGLIALGVYGGIFALFGEEFDPLVGLAGLSTIFVLVACIVIPIILVLSILRNFAERACMLENLGVIDSYRRGTSVLMANLGEAIILFLLQIAVLIVLGIFLFVPGFVAVLCCFLWPLLLAVQGAISAFLSALWTLAWRTWTDESRAAEKAPAAV
jgi:hypothetical protein